jgi:cytochrome bd-type quinol oxidase subunit 1
MDEQCVEIRSSTLLHFILFYFILFYFILFYFILFYLFYSAKQKLKKRRLKLEAETEEGLKSQKHMQ